MKGYPRLYFHIARFHFKCICFYLKQDIWLHLRPVQKCDSSPPFRPVRLQIHPPPRLVFSLHWVNYLRIKALQPGLVCIRC